MSDKPCEGSTKLVPNDGMKEKALFEVAERSRAASDPQEARRLGDELGRLVFGE